MTGNTRFCVNSKRYQHLQLHYVFSKHASDFPSSIFPGKFEFELAFDLNQRDAEGQTVLYLATCVGNLKIVELLLGFRVKGRRSREAI